MDRKHVKTGKPRGGHRKGAGRKKGGKNALALGEVRAIKAAGLRVPESATPEQRELADECLGTMTEVMRGTVYYLDAPHRLNASTKIREEICGAVKQKMEHTLDALTDEQLEARFHALMEKSQAQPLIESHAVGAPERAESFEASDVEGTIP